MKAVWVTRSFLDYRIPVYCELNRRLGGEFAVFYNADYVPARCCSKVQGVLGTKAKGLRGEWALRLGSQNGFANRGIRIPLQPGLIRAILDEKPDVLISDGFFQWTYAALWLRATRRIRHVMCYERTAHTERGAQWFRRKYRRLALRWVDAICCNGRLCGEYVRSLGFPAGRITYGHMAADVEGMAQAVSNVSTIQTDTLRAKFRLEGLVFLYVGRLIPLKGIDRLLRAWELYSGEVQSCQMTLLLVGDGPERDGLEQYCMAHGLHNVRFTGVVDYDALAPFYKAADAFIIPTLEDNWSLVVPEAMACGLPILCSRYNGCWPEMVRPENGWVFDPLDVRATVDVLKACIEHCCKLGDMGEQSERIVSEHTPQRAAQSILEACDIALAGRGTMPGEREDIVP